MSNIAEFEKKMRKGKKFEEKETKGEKIRKNLKEEIKKLDTIDKRKPGPTRVPGEQKEMIPLNLKSGGRVGFKSGSKAKGCKLAKRGKGRAYGKNS